jgi:lipooligosaccharide transport system permease protein
MIRGYQKVWSRNFFYFQKTWLVTAFWTVLEPLMYLATFGYGVGALVTTQKGVPYLDFFFAGLLCSTAVLVSYFETTYANYTKLNHQKLYSSWLMTPLTSQDIILGEILWGGTKGIIGSIGVLIVSSFFGLVKTWLFIPALIVIALLAFIFSCVGMIFTSYAKNYDSFIFSTSGLLIPMTLISGTYFPIDSMHVLLKFVAYILPLAHAVDIVRGLLLGPFKMIFIFQALYLMILAYGLFRFAASRFEKKLIS